MKKNISALIMAIALFVPIISNAAFDGTKEFVRDIGGIVKLMTPVAFGLALLFFFWGLAKFILNAGNEEARGEGKQIMVWGIIALFVMVSIWGITGFIGRELGISGSNSGGPSGSGSLDLGFVNTCEPGTQPVSREDGSIDCVSD